jgi:hypothetical protein
VASASVSTEIEERIHNALKSHPLERSDNGYRLVHPGGAGVSTLTVLPSQGAGNVAAVVEIIADYNSALLPSFHETGVQRLNAVAVHGAYHGNGRALRQIAQYSLYPNEPSVALAVQVILNAFGGQLPLGLSTALGVASANAWEQQRARHGMPRQWGEPVAANALEAASTLLRQQGLAASNSQDALWAELPLSGDCPSRSIDPQAETALLQVNMSIPHPIAGAGYLATISLPLAAAPADAAAICRRLNDMELKEVDFVTRLGAWGLTRSDGMPGYSCFIPSPRAMGELHLAVMGWCIRRALWLRDRCWVAGVGIQLDRAAER